MNAILDTVNSSPLSCQEILEGLEVRNPQELLAIIKRATELLEAQLPTSNKADFNKTVSPEIKSTEVQQLVNIFDLVDILDNNVDDIIAEKMGTKRINYYNAQGIQIDSQVRIPMARTALKESPDISRPFIELCYKRGQFGSSAPNTPRASMLIEKFSNIFQNIKEHKINISNVEKYIRILENIGYFTKLTNNTLDSLDINKLVKMNDSQKEEFKNTLKEMNAY